MRKYEEFKQMWLGKVCRDSQCVALFREFTEGFHDTPILERLGGNGGALGLFTRYDTDVGPVSRQVFERITFIQGSSDRPEVGDCVIFGATLNNRFGHVGIMDSVNPDGTITILDSDGLKALRGEPPSVVKLTVWRMDNVLGWLRFR